MVIAFVTKDTDLSQDKMNSIKILSISVLTAALTYGCNDGGGGGTAASPNGVYSGSITGGLGSPPNGPNGNEKGIIYNNRLMVFSTILDIQQSFDAAITVTNNSFSGTVSNYDNANPNPQYTADLSGSFIADTSATATFSNFSPASFNDGTINLTADTTLYNKGSATATVAGSWQGTHGNLGDATSLSIDTNGAITSGSDQAVCNFTGTVIPADTSINAYNVTIISTGGTGCISLPAATYTGLAWTEGANDGTLNLTVADGINSRSVVLTKN